jgi:hypothetical protein
MSAAQLMCALMRAGLPHQQFAYGGQDCGKAFLLDERDQLTEWIDDRGGDPCSAGWCRDTGVGHRQRAAFLASESEDG